MSRDTLSPNAVYALTRYGVNAVCPTGLDIGS
jgi:hypothetical protein